MAKGVPRRQIRELVMRWQLAKLPCLVVEGPSDVRMLNSVQRTETFSPAFRELDIYDSDQIDVSSNVVQKHGFNGTGAKQRVIAFGKEIEEQGCADGFRCVVDKDLDPFLGLNHETSVILYTDGSCMESYAWKLGHLALLAEMYQCEDFTDRDKVAALFNSISRAAAEIWAVRIVASRNPDWQLSHHESDRVLKIAAETLEHDVNKYIEICAPAKGALAQAKAALQDALAEVQRHEVRDTLNGHDLIWLLTFSLRECSRLPKHAINKELIASSIAALGARDPDLQSAPMLDAIAAWVGE